MFRWASLVSLFIAACATTPPPPTEPAPPPPPPASTKITLQVVALSDFHGWLEPLAPPKFGKYYGGIANLAGWLEHKEKLKIADNILLDNGDMWTGPTESTMLRGASVIEAYNALGFTAANIANHEFDFGPEVLRTRAKEARFPFLGANVVKAGTQESPDFLKPWIVVERQGFKVGVIGLSFVDTPRTTLAKHVADLEFRPYAETLQRVVPEVKAAGAEIVVVLFHDEVKVAQATLAALPDLGIHAVIAGQNHRKESAEAHGHPIVNPGPFGRSYVRFDFSLDSATRAIENVAFETVDVGGETATPPFAPRADIATIVEAAKNKAQQLSGEILGKTAKPLPLGGFEDSPLGQFIADAWLSALPVVDFAMINHGALRQPFPSGEITLGTLLGALPWENNIYVVRITGEQIAAQLAIDHPVVAGMTWSYRDAEGGRQVVSVVDRVGKPLDPKKAYLVAILDFMYTGGDGYSFQSLDANPVDTGLSCREPVMRAFRVAESMSTKVDPRGGARARKVK